MSEFTDEIEYLRHLLSKGAVELNVSATEHLINLLERAEAAEAKVKRLRDEAKVRAALKTIKQIAQIDSGPGQVARRFLDEIEGRHLRGGK